MKKNVYEIFEEVANQKKKSDKINVLRMNNSFTLECVLRGTFHPHIKYVVDTPVEYRAEPIPPGMSHNTITSVLNKTYLFEHNNPKRSPNLTLDKTRLLLSQLLEGLEPKEADVYMNMILKKQNVPGLTYALVKEAFPNLIP